MKPEASFAAHLLYTYDQLHCVFYQGNGLQTVVNVEVLTNEICGASSKFFFKIIGRRLQSEICAAWGRGGSKQVYGHSILFRFFGEVAIFPPEKAQQVSEFFTHFYLVKHGFYVTHESDWFLSKPAKHSSQIVCQVGALKQVLV